MILIPLEVVVVPSCWTYFVFPFPPCSFSDREGEYYSKGHGASLWTQWSGFLLSTAKYAICGPPQISIKTGERGMLCLGKSIVRSAVPTFSFPISEVPLCGGAQLSAIANGSSSYSIMFAFFFLAFFFAFNAR
jgi:hypothetical protein